MSHVTVQYLNEQGLSGTFPSRFFAKINITPSCWLWLASTNKGGYGQIHRGLTFGGTSCILSNVASWILHFGPIPKGMCVCHDCPDGDNPACVNPAHLWLGTIGENSRDMWSKERGVVPGLRGHNHPNCHFTKEQVQEIRETHHTQRLQDFADRFGVTKQAIWRIVHRKSYPD